MRIWHYLSKALGEKSGKDDKEADKVAFIRLIIVLQCVITNIAICSGIIHHW